MPIIRMDTEEVRTAAWQVDYASAELYLKPSRLRGFANSLTSIWQGGKATEFAADLRALADVLQTEVITFQRLAQQAKNEVAEWESKDTFGGSTEPSFYRNLLPALSILPIVLPDPNKSTNPEDEKVDLTSFLGRKGSLAGGEPKDVFEIKYKAIDESLVKTQGSNDFNVGFVDGKVNGEIKAGTIEAGAMFGFDDEGQYSAGLFAEAKAAEVSGEMILGSSLFGVTVGTNLSTASAEAFAGIKDGQVGATIGASAASGDVELGLNIAGVNVGAEAGLSAGVEFGFKVGKKTEVKVGPFKLGLNFGLAKT